MSKKIDYSQFYGKEYGYLTFIKELPNVKNEKRQISVTCKCGAALNVLWLNLQRGLSRSCGCRKKEFMYGRENRHLYKIWTAIRQRCKNPNNTAYRFYGGRGVEICKEWDESYDVFYDWCMSRGWKRGLEVDKDSKGTGMLYSPENCVLITHLENVRSTRYTKLSLEKVAHIRSCGLTTKELSIMYNVKPGTITNIKGGRSWRV